MNESQTSPISNDPVEESPAPAGQTADNSGRRFAIAIVVVIIGLLGLVAWGLINNSRTRPVVGAEAPDFEISFFDGYEWEQATADTHLTDLRGQPVVINFWASWCVECHEEADMLEAVWREYADAGVVFLGVDYVDTEPKALEYLARYDITYPNAPDLGSRVSDAYEITAVPETFVIGPDGTIAAVFIGPVREAELRLTLDSLLTQ